MARSIMSATSLDQMTATIEFNKDNSLLISMKLGEESISFEATGTGTYEVLSDDLIRIHEDEMTNCTTIFGITQTETEDLNKTSEYNYRLDGNTLTFIHDDFELQFKRS